MIMYIITVLHSLMQNNYTTNQALYDHNFVIFDINQMLITNMQDLL